MEKTGKKKGRSLLTLKNEELASIVTIEAPSKIRMGFFQTFLELRYGLPPLDVKPIDWVGVVKLLGFFVLPFVIASTANLWLILASLSLIVLNYDITRNYYRDYLLKMQSRGYVLQESEYRFNIEQAGAGPADAQERLKKIKIKRVMIFGSAFVVFTVLSLFSGGDEFVTTVRSGSFRAFPDYTVEEGIDNIVDNPEWTHIIADDGNHYVNVSGLINFDGQSVDFLIQFKVFNDLTGFQVNALELEGIPQSKAAIELFLQMMYS